MTPTTVPGIDRQVEPADDDAIVEGAGHALHRHDGSRSRAGSGAGSPGGLGVVAGVGRLWWLRRAAGVLRLLRDLAARQASAPLPRRRGVSGRGASQPPAAAARRDTAA